MEHKQPLCPNCEEIIEQLGVWTDDAKRSAIIFCPNCGKVIGVQLLAEGISQL